MKGNNMARHETYWSITWRQLKKHKLGMAALAVVAVFCLTGVYAPFLASSKPFIVQYEGEWYFPLFRYLFFSGFYTKRLDIFFNLLIFTIPLAVIAILFWHRSPKQTLNALLLLSIAQLALFFYFGFGPLRDPAADPGLAKKKEEALKKHPLPSWSFELNYMNAYARLNLLLRAQQQIAQQERLQKYGAAFAVREGKPMPTLWQLTYDNENALINREQEILNRLIGQGKQQSEEYKQAKANIDFIKDRRQWIDSQIPKLKHEVMPLMRPFHWEDDAGGSQSFNRYLPFWELTRINRKDLVAALIFGVRISLVVGILAVTLALAIALPVGSFAGFYGGKFDIIVCRLLEVWESMPTFFMLLMVVAILQSKSIFLIIMVIGLFGWTTFSRFIRGEFFKQRNLAYVEACRAIGFRDSYIMFSHILPNAIPPVLTLLPFSIMAAITSEAGLSFLGLGEEGSCSWGVLMDEGRTAFPGESYLLWPPAILLTTLLIAIALVGDALRDCLDPKMHR